MVEIPEYPGVLRTLEASARLDRRETKWAAAALESECGIVSRAANGERNSVLNTAAVKLGHKVASGYLDEREVRQRLYDAACANGLDTDDGGPDGIHATITSGLEAGKLEPEEPKDRPDLVGRSPSGGLDFNPVRAAQPAPVPTPARQSRFYSAADLKGKAVPPREWLVDGLIPKKTVTLFSGDGGTGKSLLALQLAIGAVTNGGWLNKAVTPGRAIFLSAEDDDDELHRRTDDILRAYGMGYEELTGLTLRSVAGEDALLALEGNLALMASELFNELDRRAADENPDLIVIDTLADVYPANENDRAKARQFIGILRGLALKRNCAVVLLAHPSLTGLNSGTGTSGSTGWNNSVRSRLYLERVIQEGYEPDPDVRRLSNKKANYGRIGGEISLRWDSGAFVAEEESTGLDRLAAGAKAERVFLTLLQAFTEQGRRVNSSGGTQYAPKIFAEHPDAEGCTKKAFKTAMETLLRDRKVRVSKEGPPSRPVTFLEMGAE